MLAVLLPKFNIHILSGNVSYSIFLSVSNILRDTFNRKGECVSCFAIVCISNFRTNGRVTMDTFEASWKTWSASKQDAIKTCWWQWGDKFLQTSDRFFSFHWDQIHKVPLIASVSYPTLYILSSLYVFFQRQSSNSHTAVPLDKDIANSSYLQSVIACRRLKLFQSRVQTIHKTLRYISYSNQAKI